MRAVIPMCITSLALAAAALGGSTARAQSSASTYSYGTYNPVQAAINRNTMNAAILRQASGGARRPSRAHPRHRTTRQRRR